MDWEIVRAAEYIERESNFSFELRCRQVLENLRPPITREPVFGWETKMPSHGGHYKDPVTGKFREFDFRLVRRHRDRRTALYFAIECKNIFGALLGVGTLASSYEAHHWALKYGHSTDHIGSTLRPTIAQECCPSTIYRIEEPVMREIACLHPDTEIGDQRRFRAEERKQTQEVHGRYGQAIHSAYEFTFAASEAHRRTGIGDHLDRAIILPIVVVPDGKLWTVTYNDEYESGQPQSVDHFSHWLDHRVLDASGGHIYTLSRVDFVTLGHLDEFIGLVSGRHF